MMLDPEVLRARLPVGRLGEPLHYFTRTGSTNDVASGLAAEGARHGTLVVADEQTAGRGRLDRSWSTPPKSALAFSLLLRPDPVSPAALPGLNAVGALAVAEALDGLGIEAAIKWPNDVLVNGRKIAGVLVEAGWQGDRLAHAVLGIGVNVAAESAPPDAAVQWPATTVEAATGKAVDRMDLLVQTLGSLDRWLGRLGGEELRAALEQRLAYRGQWVELQGRGPATRGILVGLSPNGRIRLRDEAGRERTVGDEFSSLRPLDRDGG